MLLAKLTSIFLGALTGVVSALLFKAWTKRQRVIRRLTMDN